MCVVALCVVALCVVALCVVVRALYVAVEPAFLPHTGHAPMPCPASTLLAMAICCDFDAWLAVAAYLVPPYAFQVLRLNCRPPK